MTTTETFETIYASVNGSVRQRLDDVIRGAAIVLEGRNEHIHRDSSSDSDVPTDRQPLKEEHK